MSLAVVYRDTRYNLALSNAPSMNTDSANVITLSPALPAHLLAATGVMAKHVRVYVTPHHSNQGYQLDLVACPVATMQCT